MKKYGLSIIIFIILCGILDADYPRIKSLQVNDILFAQVQKDVEGYYKAVSRRQISSAPPLAFFVYSPQQEDTLFSLSARLNLPFETIASVNGLSQAADFFSRQQILIPNMPGLFIPVNPTNSLEEFILSWREKEEKQGEKVVARLNGKDVLFLFFRGEKYHAVERAFFLKILFRFPLDHIVLTSGFGTRRDPFNGHPSFHNGIDLGAPLGTLVYSAREGIVSEAGYNEVLGNYVRISHPGGYETIYGHLSEILVKISDVVKAGIPLGKVGISGYTTGPHLHFEILKDGKALNPNSLLPSERNTALRAR
jgi:murein DD-endopeptidase MepM/ murein hydrolase activator NlpD